MHEMLRTHPLSAGTAKHGPPAGGMRLEQAGSSTGARSRGTHLMCSSLMYVAAALVASLWERPDVDAASCSLAPSPLPGSLCPLPLPCKR